MDIKPNRILDPILILNLISLLIPVFNPIIKLLTLSKIWKLGSMVFKIWLDKRKILSIKILINQLLIIKTTLFKSINPSSITLHLITIRPKTLINKK